MNQNTKKLLVALILVLGFISPFVCSYADDNIQLDITLKNKQDGDDLGLFQNIRGWFTVDVDKSNLPSGYNIRVVAREIDGIPGYENIPLRKVDGKFKFDYDYFKPDSVYKLKYRFDILKNNEPAGWGESFSKFDVTINGVEAYDQEALDSMGIDYVVVDPPFGGDEGYIVYVSVVYNKLPDVGYMEQPYKFNVNEGNTYISGGQNEDEILITGTGAPDASVLKNILHWFDNYADGYDSLYFEQPDGGFCIELPEDSSSLFRDAKKDIYVYERSFYTRMVDDMRSLFDNANVYGKVRFDLRYTDDISFAFAGTKLKDIGLYDGSDVRAASMLSGVRTLERLEFEGLKDLSIQPNTFIGDYVVKDRTTNTTEYKKQDEKYDFIDNHDYLVELGSDDSKININTLSITIPESARYTGEAIEPEVEVKDGDTVLAKGESYTVVYKDNVEVGTMTTEVTGIGDYVGTAIRSTQIVKMSPGGKPSFTPITSAGKTLADAKLSTGSINVEGTIAWEKSVSTTVEKDASYKWIFTPNNTEFYNVKYGLLTPYSDNIVQKDISTLTFTLVVPGLDYGSYTGQAMTPDVVVKDSGNALVKDESYTVSYENNVNVGTAKVIVTGIGEYTGTKELTFKIVKAMPLGLPSFTLIKEDGKKLSDTSIQLGTINAVGTVKWEKPLSTTVEKAKAYKWVFTPTDINNYEKLTGEFVVYPEGEHQVQRMPHVGIHSDNYFESIENKVSYKDSKDSDWFYPYVNYVTNRQIMNGTGNQMFSPKSKITKAMLVTMLFRLSGDENVTLNNVWVDLKDGKWYTEAAKWALKNGIATANARNEFQPNHELTREEFVKMIYLYANYKNYYTGDENDLADFVDKNMLADDCVNSFKWAVQIGIINGIDTTHLAPKNTSNRAEMATIFTRFMDVYGL